MDRRTFIAVAAPWLALPLAAAAQQAGRMHRVGYCGVGTADTPEAVRILAAFGKG